MGGSEPGARPRALQGKAVDLLRIRGNIIRNEITGLEEEGLWQKFRFAFETRGLIW
jgi:hypothetical protein